ncbi:MAG: porin, partial [Roseiarcus sp.]|uniref:porin n=1 Tax=Roseiarcus sp. TaxID=1969460 RepID=UPI003C1D8C0A
MKFTKSLLLGSAATLVVVAGAQAADLPTKKGAPAAEYVKVCKVGDIAGFIIPGSDTCLKISGYVNAQIAMGNVSDEYTLAPLSEFAKVYLHHSSPHVTWGDPAMTLKSAATQVNDIGYYTRGQVNFDAVTNTAMGPLLAHIELQGDSGDSRFDAGSPGADVTLNAGYVQWAGITAGKHGSFYDYLAGGDTWKDFFSPDHSGTPINLLAYTATFGGGFSATVSLEQNESVSGFAGAADNIGFPFGSSNFFILGTGNVTSISGKALGVRAPDIVASLDVTQSWGGAHLAGVAHNDRYSIAGTINETLFPIANPTIASLESSADTWGFGVIGGVTFTLPMLSAGSKIAFQ